MNQHNPNSQTRGLVTGRFRISPLVRLTDEGRYAAALSIRSGRGSSAHDRVLRFSPEFSNRAAASVYAMTQAEQWLYEQDGKGNNAGAGTGAAHPHHQEVI